MSGWTLVAVWVGLPAVTYTLLLYAFDRHEREPLWALACALAGGALAALGAGWLELRVDQVWPYLEGLRQGDAEAALRAAFVVVAPAEETAKLLVVVLLTRTRAFNEPVDGIVYAGTVALGFAALEGALAAQSAGSATLAMRAALAMPGHLCFSALWGAGVGGVWFWGWRAWPYAVGSFATAVLAHGLYDYLLLADGGARRAAVVPLVAAMAMVTAISFRALLSISPFRPRRGAPVRCPRCHRQSRGTPFCAGCGAALILLERPAPVALAPTLTAFVVGVCLAVGGLSTLAGVLAASPVRVLTWAGQGQLEALLVTLGVALSAGVGAGLTTRRMGGARPTLEAVIATGLTCLCLALWLALSGGLLTLVLYLSPLAILVAGLSARAGRT